MKALLNRTLEHEFHKADYKELILNLFNRFDFSKEHTLKHQFNEAEKQAIEDFLYLGTFEDSEKKNIDVLVVELKGGSKVERARSLQRNLIGKYLKTNLKDSALVAFYSKDNPDWRLSFVRMDYKITDRGVKVAVDTPPKRYSFLVGKDEPSHTAQKQLLPLLDDKNIPLIDEIEKTFSIEKVTREFYTEIAKKFTELVGGERKIGSKKIVEKGCLRLPSTDDDTIEKEFAVRLIGRLLFCWFLKKKKSENGEPLLRSEIISSSAVQQVPGYYHGMLERLFFQVLNTPVEKRIKEANHGYWPRVPFLNGGLFEPHNHDFYKVDSLGTSVHLNTLKVPDKWLKELFEIFELYNFTIDESSTIDIDISVDPEMLGRIFENLLAEINPQTGETARKSTGSYYTPRPIVEYMVNESLKQYLKTQISSRSNDVIARSETPSPVIARDKVPKQSHNKLGAGSAIFEGKIATPSARNDGNDGDNFDDKLSKLLSYADDEIDLTESEKDAIIDALDRVKIIDPACGSGAFPMGILHKMLLILQKIDSESKKWLSRKLARIDNKLLRQEVEAKLKKENWDYVHKLGIIQNSIYGVDIQAIAVEISKLRFFLSLVVDEMIDDSRPNRGIEPLPNLEFKFVAANSLIGLPKAEGGLAESHSDIEKLRELREAYFTAYGDGKRRVEKEFRDTQHKMFLHALNWQATGSQTYKLSEWNPFEDESASWFDPEWMFGITDGFDVVIANPPYVRHEAIKELKPELKKQFPDFFCGTADIYTYFYHRGLDILKPYGHLCFISPNKFMRAGYGKNTRTLLTTEATPKTVIDFCDLPIFDATTYPSIVLVEKTTNPPSPPFAKVGNMGNPPLEKGDGGGFFHKCLVATFTDATQLERLEEALSDIGFPMPISALKNEGWNLERPTVLALMEKLREAGTPLGEYVKGRFYRGILTGFNEAFVIDEETKKRLIKEDPKSKELIKPWLRGRDIKKWKAEWAGLYLINIQSSSNHHWLWSDEKIESKARKIFKETYSAIHDHLIQWKDKLQKRDDQGKFWWELRSCAYHQEFERPKIVMCRFMKSPLFCYDEGGKFFNDANYFFNLDDKYVLGFFLSKVCWTLLTRLGTDLSGGFYQLFINMMETVPVFPASDKQKAPIIERVNKILANPDSPDVPRLEAEIDNLVYKLYNLTPEEIAIVYDL